MEKYRFYVDLPGDFWESGVLQRHLAAQRAEGAVRERGSGRGRAGGCRSRRSRCVARAVAHFWRHT